MDGKDSVGRRISLLNEDPSAPANRLPSLEPGLGLRSRTSSYTSSPCLSPQTPQLSRSVSTDSVMMNSPSPITPGFAYEDAQSPNMPQIPYYMGGPPQVKQENMLSYSMAPQPYPHPAATPVFIRAPGTERQPMPPAQPRTKKNQYPCPLAAQYSCKDYFTTSGHAARHAKKHTGKKDAICPDCRKAFTRKDNMEQHRRTHAHGRNSRNGSKDANDDSRVKKAKATPRPKPSPIQAAQLHDVAMMDPSLPVSPASSFGHAPAPSFSHAPAVQPVSEYLNASFSDRMNYPPPEHYQINTPASNSTWALETLALACGEERRTEA